MQKTKKLSIGKIILPAVGLIAGLAMLSPVIPNLDSSLASSYDYSAATNTDAFKVSAYSLAGASPAGETFNASFSSQTITLTKYQWADVKYFDLSFDVDTASIPDSVNGEYEYRYYVSWTPIDFTTEIPSSGNAQNIIGDIYKGTVSSKEDIPSSIRFYVDDAEGTYDGIYKSGNSILGKDYQKNGGWGLYQFYILVNDYRAQRGVSQLYYLTPTDVKDIESAPKIKPEKVFSNKQMSAAYNFTIDDNYKYVKRSLINWYVEGSSASRQKYVLLLEDIPSTDYKSIFPNNNYDRTGTSFLFDFEIEGTWTVRCVATSQADASITKQIVSEEFSTVKVISLGAIIGIVAGAVAVIIIALVIIIVVSKKKERIW